MVQLVTVEDHLSVANMVAQHGYVSPANPVAIRYDALAYIYDKKYAVFYKSHGWTQKPRIISAHHSESCGRRLFHRDR
jgi:hypothetical protein